MKFLIDHTQKSIHRTTYANDKCEFHHSKIEKREFSFNLGYIESLKRNEKYQECEHCNILSTKPTEM